MKVKYDWNPQYPNPNYWRSRTPLHEGMPKLFHLYQDLNDNKIRRFFKKLKGKVLDAGCGNGRFLPYADIGVDFSRGMLKRAKSRHLGENLVLASILHLPFRDRVFSVAFTVDILLHIDLNERKDAINELNRVAHRSYNFLPEHRSVIPFILTHLRAIPFKPQRMWLPYITLFLAFPLDRVRKLKIESSFEALRKLD
jgi:SAM-dependent methyltransferase